MLDKILTQVESPVARMRLLSTGMHNNNRLENGSMAAGDSGCLACGNCIDNCPVIREKYRFVTIQNQRTSMSLENLVGEECRRCYRCINSCPQVGKELKEYALSFRKGAKIVHFVAVATIVLLAATGITSTHWGTYLPTFEQGVLQWSHRFLGIIFIMLPAIYWFVDRRHMTEMMRSILHWSSKDKAWLMEMAQHVLHPKKNSKPAKYQYNPAQKAWGFYLLFIAFPILVITGIGQWYLRGNLLSMSGSMNDPLYLFGIIHILFALLTDIGLMMHVYFKYIRNSLGTIFELFKCFFKKRNFNYLTLYK